MTCQPIKRGVTCPTMAPLKPNCDINLDKIAPLIGCLVQKGFAGINSLGSAGEGPLYSADERKIVAAASVEAVARRA